MIQDEYDEMIAESRERLEDQANLMKKQFDDIQTQLKEKKELIKRLQTEKALYLDQIKILRDDLCQAEKRGDQRVREFAEKVRPIRNEEQPDMQIVWNQAADEMNRWIDEELAKLDGIKNDK